MKRFLITAFCTLLALPAMAQEDALRDLPGFVDFGEMNSIYGEPKVNISIGGALLGFVGALAKNEDPQAAAIFSKLQGVRVSVYATGGDAAAALDQVSRVKKNLSALQWSPVVQVNEEGQQVQIFMKMEGEVMDGLTLMAVDGEEAVFINVIGQLDPEELSQLMGRFDVDLDESLEFNFN
ncbi:MAG TPA: DUF4252 domain-containing protein [Xanthomonadales bacterium]|nr:DUF4252 domain-containing protein [Xanthomonadales bacterium]